MARYALALAVMIGIGGLAVAAPASESPTTQPALGELRPILSPEARRRAARERIDRFVEHVRASATIDASARRMVTDAWKRHRNDDEPEDFLIAGVAIVSEPFKVALTALEKEDYARADKGWQALVAAKDPYVSLHAAGLEARSLVEQDKLEEAEKVLAPLAAKEKELMDKTFLETEVDFLLGYCQLSNLRYDQARATLERFVRQHPNAPGRFGLAARQMLQELRARMPGRLGEVSDLMAYSGRRLAHGHAGEPVQLKQRRTIELLTNLITEAEEQEKGCKKCGGKGCKACKGGGDPSGIQPPSSPAKRSALPGGTGKIGDLHRSPSARPGEEWGKMRPEERRRILQSLRTNFPARYRQLVEQYYKQLAREH